MAELQDLYTMLCDGHVQAQGVMDTLPIPVVVLDIDFQVTVVNPAFLKVFGVTAAETLGQPLFALGNGQWDIPELRHLLTEVIPRATAVLDFSVSHDFPGIGPRTILVGARRMEAPGRHGREILLTFEDVTERGRADAARELLLGEMRHRQRNLMGIIRALVAQPRVAGRSAAEYRDALLGRLGSVARAQEASLTAGEEMGLAAFITGTLEPMADGRIRLEAGPVLRLAGTQLLPLGLILHELATNSLKYGALSAPRGEVRVAWELLPDGAAPLLRLTWREAGGPRIRPPRQHGFGTQLIEMCATVSLQGSAELDYAPEGLIVTLTLPLRPALSAAPRAAAPSAAAP
ncbi:PAS domain-containing protein [Sediminicoccus sp. BL-A-41-H5]|uniref:PAS domain-containing protein n=1 Tax=Sediminicoccus sp. BL-A-41-H5 TaxID=3421106 RepID=UPI003D67DCAC